MPCPSGSVPSNVGAEVRDLLELHAVHPQSVFRPRTRVELVQAVVESGGRSLRAIGSNYSLSAAGVAENIVDTDRLNLHLSQPFGASIPLPAARLRSPGSDFLIQVAAHDGHAAGRCFIHVEAGMKIKDLLPDLHTCGLDLPTMGAGGGQSLAGALATSSHGADFRVSPLVEWIRAIHLIAAGGQEWWLTPADSIFGGPGLTATPDACGDTRFVADDSAFNAARVAVGRMGIIYALIVEVVPAYGLLEVTIEQPWSEIRSELAAGALTASSATGIFGEPNADLESGWFKAEIRERTVVRYATPTPVPSQAVSMEYVGGRARPLAPVSPDLEPRLFRQMLNSLDLGPLATALRGSAAKPLHHLNIALSLPEPERCFVARRWRVPGGLPKVAQLPSTAQPDEIQLVVENPQNHRRPTALILPLFRLLTPDKGTIGGTWLPQIAALLGISEKAQRILEFRDQDMPRLATMSEQTGTTIGEALFLILYKLATDPILRPDSTRAAAFAVSKLIGGDPVAGLLRCGLASEILDTHNYKLDGAQSGNSAEFFFDATRAQYLQFVDTVIQRCNAYGSVFGYLGIRFTPNCTASVAMQRFPLTVSVEVATARSRLADVYATFWNDVHESANALGALAHWGQEFRQSPADIADRYGSGLRTWRRVLAQLSTGAPATFSTPFSRAVGLEPSTSDEIFDVDEIDAYFAGLQSAVD